MPPLQGDSGGIPHLSSPFLILIAFIQERWKMSQTEQIALQVQEAGHASETVDFHFGEDGLVPVVVQEAGTNEVLLVASMNRQSFELTLQTGKAHFWSKSRQKLWLKGETSGDFLLVDSLWVNCEENTVLLKVTLAGKAACHTGHKSCYYRQIEGLAPGVNS